MKPSDVRALRDEEIKLEIERQRSRLYQLRTQAVTEKVEDTSLRRQTKRDIARLITERRARHIAKAGGTAGK
jgi:large subunit ribosomal protein L29